VTLCPVPNRRERSIKKRSSLSRKQRQVRAMSIDTSEFDCVGGAVDDILTVSVQQRGAHDVITARGEIDIASAPRLRAVLTDLLDHGRDRLVVDLDRVDFIDSTGLGLLLEAHRRTQEGSGSLGLVCHTSLCTRLFQVSGLDRVLPFHDSVDAAVNA
jgi:anti-sigma B factor antagonist